MLLRGGGLQNSEVSKRGLGLHPQAERGPTDGRFQSLKSPGLRRFSLAVSHEDERRGLALTLAHDDGGREGAACAHSSGPHARSDLGAHALNVIVTDNTMPLK